ncbi:hypothetical protein Q9L58_010614 [Maublancomyces gigas]|uniref:DUF4145 domain-containing protein n=1 Tax=Discina gigas TaxID=1032678 RepID=A0ABR3G409_9PEZI
MSAEGGPKLDADCLRRSVMIGPLPQHLRGTDLSYDRICRFNLPIDKMSELVADCPRCGSKKTTFSLTRASFIGTRGADWQKTYEAFCICRHCHRATVFVLTASEYFGHAIFASAEKLVDFSGSVSAFMSIAGFVSIKDVAAEAPPEHLPDSIDSVFREAVTCKSVACYNASATMFRLCLDLATRDKLPAIVAGDATGPNYKTRRDLGLRLPWLFDNKVLPEDLRDLSHAVKEDGNDGAHAGTMTAEDVDDLLDFTTALLERMYTEPARVILAKERREARRKPTAS